MDFEQQKKVILQMQKCQRNWDYSKNLPKEISDYLLWIAKHSPSKQHEAFYDVYWTTDRKTIQEYSRETWGNTFTRNPPSCRRNSQANAHMYMLFVAKEPETRRNSHTDGSTISNKTNDRWETAYVSIGIAIGLVMQAANSLGLSTGCNKSHSGLDANLFWEKRLGILDDVLNDTKKITYGVGIGYPQENRNRWETDEHEILIGAANGIRVTTLEDDDPVWLNRLTEHPHLARKNFRKAKIVDINSNKQETDPYGQIHDMPKNIDFTTHSHIEREIKIIEIK